jgi:hypothetical protein
LDRTFAKIIEELGYPPVFLVSPEQFQQVEGISLKGSFGIASGTYPIIAIRKGLRGRVKANTLYHEAFHILFPHRPHWYIECCAEKMARGGGRGFWSVKYGKSVDDVPSRARILQLARRASERLKR